MRKEEILKELAKHNSTVLSFPDRGPWGQSSWRGNNSGWCQAFFINLLNVNSMAEAYAGSGTGYDVAKDMGIEYAGLDLNPNPVRPGIVAMNILDYSKELPELFHDADMTFFHPPYPSLKGIKYAGGMWKDTEDLAKYDIQQMPFEEGMRAINQSIMRVYSSQRPGSYGVVLVGNIRANGGFHSMAQSLVIPGELYQTFVKVEHNCFSDRGSTYHKSTRALTAHEDIIVFKKPSGYEVCYVLPTNYVMDIRDSVSASWMDVVMTVARELHQKQFTSQDIIKSVAGRKKAAKNNNVEAKVRQTLQKAEKAGRVRHLDSNLWAVAVA